MAGVDDEGGGGEGVSDEGAGTAAVEGIGVYGVEGGGAVSVLIRFHIQTAKEGDMYGAGEVDMSGGLVWRFVKR